MWILSELNANAMRWDKTVVDSQLILTLLRVSLNLVKMW